MKKILKSIIQLRQCLYANTLFSCCFNEVKEETFRKKIWILIRNNFEDERFTMELKIRLTVLFFLMAAILCLVVSFSTDNWIENLGFYSGLWRKCISRKGQTTCKDLPNDASLPGFFNYVRTFYVIGLGFFVAGLLYFVLVVIRPRTFGLGCLVVFVIIGGLSLIIGLSIFTYFNDDQFSNSIRFHWSYFVGWLGVFMAIVAAGISCYEVKNPSSPYGQAYRLE